MSAERICGGNLLHDWRLIDETQTGNLRDGGEVRRRWYCTRCRKIEATVERARAAGEDT